MNDHQQIQTLIAIYRDLDETERHQVDQHVAACAGCAAQLTSYQTMDQDLAQLPQPRPDAALYERFYAALGARQADQHPLVRLARMFAPNNRPQLALTAAALVLALLLSLEAVHFMVEYRAVQRAARQAAEWASTYQPLKQPGETDDQYLAQRVHLIKETAIAQAKGLTVEDVQVWGFPSFVEPAGGWSDADLRDHPGLPGLPVRVRVSREVEPLNPLLRALVPPVRIGAQIEKINQGTQTGWGSVAPPALLPPPPPQANGRVQDGERQNDFVPSYYVPGGDGIIAHQSNSQAETFNGRMFAQGGERRLAAANQSVESYLTNAGLRLVIKNATFELQVENTDRAIDQITQIASDSGGYIVSQQVWHNGESKLAAISIAVPVQSFENTLRRLRLLAALVVSEQASGQDVTEQYVDLESRLRNLQATRDRIRSFLDQAESVKEALQVNTELSAIEEQIEQVQGRLNYLSKQSDFATVTINLGPAPLPSPTLERWHVKQMAEKATNTLIGIGQSIIDALVWLVIVWGPWGLLFYLLIWGLTRRFLHRPTIRGQGDEG